MRRELLVPLAAVLRVAVGVALLAMAWIGAVLLTQRPAEAAFAVVLGATGGLTVGLATTWSQEQSVSASDLVRFPVSGIGALAALQGASALGRWGTALALVLVGLWWLLSTLAPASPAPPASPTRPPARSPASAMTASPLTARPDVLGRIALSDLCRLWEDLRFGAAQRPGGPPVQSEADLVEVRERLLDEIERRNPAGFARWMSQEAPDNLARYVAAGEGGSS
jgi:hypothetical protein